jgi:threonine/homoserine/homoserine lactone efflux protein
MMQSPYSPFGKFIHPTGVSEPWVECGLIAITLLFAAIVLSSVIVGWLRHSMYKRIRDDAKGTPLECCAEQEDELEPEGKVEWLGELLGGLEVLVYASAVATVGIQAGGTFFLVWVGLKMATGWQKITENRYQLRRAMAALILNLVNLLLAVATGSLIATRALSCASNT